MTISFKNRTYEVEQLRYAFTSSGYHFYVFEDLHPLPANGRFICAVSLSNGQRVSRTTVHFMRFYECKNAISAFLDFICRYA